MREQWVQREIPLPKAVWLRARARRPLYFLVIGCMDVSELGGVYVWTCRKIQASSRARLHLLSPYRVYFLSTCIHYPSFTQCHVYLPKSPIFKKSHFKKSSHGRLWLFAGLRGSDPYIFRCAGVADSQNRCKSRIVRVLVPVRVVPRVRLKKSHFQKVPFQKVKSRTTVTFCWPSGVGPIYFSMCGGCRFSK